jgi:hypothetical protein
MDLLDDIILQIELHSVEGISRCFEQGLDPNIVFRNAPLIYELTSEYARTPRFRDCVKTFVDFGLEMEDKALLAVLLDDSTTLETLVSRDVLEKKYSLRCAYTPMDEVSLLHICAEFNHINCARVLVNKGADINVKAGMDENRFGGQTPVFHTVNQNGNQSEEMLRYLVHHSTDLLLTIPGLIWGKGYEWETLIPAVNPVSYAMMGLLPQMHRDEKTIFKTVSFLLKNAYGIEYTPQNVPNRYLK